MKKMLPIVFVCSVLLVACGSSKKKVSDDGILTKEELVSVLVDVHLYDAKVSTIAAKGNNAHPRTLPEFYDSVAFANHDCNDSIFRASVEYYTMEGKIKEIYDKVVDSLNTLRLVTEQAEVDFEDL